MSNRILTSSAIARCNIFWLMTVFRRYNLKRDKTEILYLLLAHCYSVPYISILCSFINCLKLFRRSAVCTVSISLVNCTAFECVRLLNKNGRLASFEGVREEIELRMSEGRESICTMTGCLVNGDCSGSASITCQRVKIPTWNAMKGKNVA